jgi:hypothetical protein
MNIVKFIISLLTWLLDKLNDTDIPATIESPATQTQLTPRTPTPVPINSTTHHVSLYLKDGTLISRSRSNDEYYIRTDGNVYVKDKGRWVHMPDVIGLSFYKKNA